VVKADDLYGGVVEEGWKAVGEFFVGLISSSFPTAIQF
jgi:hypothetical protein